MHDQHEKSINKVHFITLGCSSNQAETEIMSGILSENGYLLVSSKEEADIIVINICTVKGDKSALEAISEVKDYIAEEKRLGNQKHIVVAGCIPPTRDSIFRSAAPEAAFVKTDNIHKIAEVVEELIKGNPLTLIGRNNEPKLNYSNVRGNKSIAIIPINNSCNDACTFCGVKLIKGKLLSYPKEQILSSIKRALFSGCKEIWITSQDTGAYGIDLEESKGRCMLPNLINSITLIPFDFKLRVGMFNPMNIVGVEEELIDAYRNPKVFKFAHIPLQSGSDYVLKRMKRRYTKTQVVDLVNLFRTNFPELTFATDVITGFPGERDTDFEETVDVLNITKPEVMHISRFVEIPNTAATLLDEKVHGRITKERSTVLAHLHRKISEEQNKKWLGWEGECFVFDKNQDKGDYIAHNDSYLQVILKNGFDILGKKVRVKVVSTNKHYLIGEIVNVIEEKPIEIVIKV